MKAAKAEAAAKAKAEADEAARRRAEEAARLAASMVDCVCGEKFLPHLLAQHQRGCEAYLIEQRAGQELQEGFVACQWCARSFFPDRLPVHLRVCKKAPKDQAGGIRPTITSEAMLEQGPTVGEYSADPAKRRRAFQMGAAVAMGALNSNRG